MNAWVLLMNPKILCFFPNRLEVEIAKNQNPQVCPWIFHRFFKPKASQWISFPKSQISFCFALQTFYKSLRLMVSWFFSSRCSKSMGRSVPEFIDPHFRENKPKTLVFSHWEWAFWACFRENWVYNFGHWILIRSFVCLESISSMFHLKNLKHFKNFFNKH